MAQLALFPAALDLSHIDEILEISDALLQRSRSRNHSFVQKVTVLRGYLEMHRMFPDRDYSNQLSKGLAEVTAAVHLHLNTESPQSIADFGACCEHGWLDVIEPAASH
jgi:hypothetical protein